MKQPKTYSDKLRACNHEALITCAVLVLIVVLWWVFGYGLSMWGATADVRVFGVPLWAVAGTVGTWAVVIVAAVVLSRVFFKDFDFEDDDDNVGSVGADSCKTTGGVADADNDGDDAC